MSEASPALSVDFLPTEDDFINFVLTEKNAKIEKSNKIIFRVIGFIVILCGVAAIFFIGGGLMLNICWILLVAIGLFVISYYDMINPYMIRSSAKNIYNKNKEKFVSKSIEFFDDSIKITSDRYKGVIPFKYIYKIVESKKTVIIYFDLKESVYIPKRVFSDKEYECYKKITEKFGEKYGKTLY